MRSRLAAAVIMAIPLVGLQAADRPIAVRQAGSEPKANFSTVSQVVVLHVAVRDRKGYISGLEQSAFQVFENKQPQPISYFSNQDAPVTVGLVIDSSGSMGGNRDRVIAAALAFARNSNPDDEIFVLGFNENIKTPLPPDAPFTHDIATLRTALGDAIGSRGRSAVYDAVSAGLKYLNKGKYGRRVLVLVSDGGDNASSTTREQVLADAQASNALIYTVAVIDPLEAEADPGFLRRLSKASGGESFQPSTVEGVTNALQNVVRDIRSMYTVGYVPSSRTAKEELRGVSVNVTLPNGRKAMVRTRGAYMAGLGLERSSNGAPVAH